MGFLGNILRNHRSSAGKHTKAVPARQSFILEPIESRLLLSADLLGMPNGTEQISAPIILAPANTLPVQPVENAAAQAQSHLSTELPPSPSTPESHGLPAQAVENAAAQAHLPTELPVFPIAVRQFVHDLLAAPDNGGIGAQVSDLAQAQHNTANQLGGTSQTTPNVAAREAQNDDEAENDHPQGGAVSQFVHELLAAPDHGGIGAQVSAFAQAQHSSNVAADQAENDHPQGGAVSQFVHELLAAPDHGGIGAQVSAFAQAQHSPNIAGSEAQNDDEAQNNDPQGGAVSQFVHELLAAPDHGGIGAQ